MSAFFTSASSQLLLTNSITLTFPFTIGMWVRPTTSGVLKTMFSIGASSTDYACSIQQTVADAVVMSICSGGSTFSATCAAAVIPNHWMFILASSFAANNRIISIYRDDGTLFSASDGNTRTLATTVGATLGCLGPTTPTQYFDGYIAEFWILSSEFQNSGGGSFTKPSIVTALALNGIFSFPHVTKDIVDYRSLRYALGSDQDAQPDYDMGNKGRQTWVNTNGVIRAAHPPLAAGYKGPTNQIQNRVV